MPAVFVHGVPDTERVWRAVIDRLQRKDVVTVSLPGFGCALPAGFEPTKEGYVDWLLGRLAAIDGPIDLVGHDWGALLVLRSVSLKPDLVRTWAAGSAPLHPEYEWHDAAKMWQTPELGEQVMALSTPETMTEGLAAAGVPAEEAAAAAANVDETMKQCILRLYRSAVNVGREWGGDLGKIRAPGLVLWADRDPFVAPHFGDKLAASTGARIVHFDCGHWWQQERPAEVAAELEKHWRAAS